MVNSTLTGRSAIGRGIWRGSEGPDYWSLLREIVMVDSVFVRVHRMSRRR
jgi:hypothetical protein